MFHRSSVLFVLALILASTAFAADRDLTSTLASEHAIIPGGLAHTTKSDSVVVYGGLGTLEGQFETAEGLPDWQDWAPVDNTLIQNYWNVTNWQMADLDPRVPDNYVWWCGTTFDNDCAEGYGHRWDSSLEWYGTVADPSSSVDVWIYGAYNVSILDYGYDYLQLQAETSTGWSTIQTYDGEILHQFFDETFTLWPGDFIDGQVRLRFRFWSDGAWNDEDCILDSAGGAQLDKITVKFQQDGAGFTQIGEVETCQPGSTLQWAIADPPTPVGNFGQVWAGLADLDPCVDNTSPQIAFIDDGLVVPGTGGTSCITWCYGPGGYIVNPEGGLAGPDDHIDCMVVSPVIDLPGPDYDGLKLGFDVYRHLPYMPGLCHTWFVRSAAAGEDITLKDWDNDNLANFGNAEYHRFDIDASEFVVADATQVQVALGVLEIGWVWGWVAIDASPAPYFDNVRVTSYQLGGPQLFVYAKDIVQDRFPDRGAPDWENLGNNSVRFDPMMDQGIGGFPYIVQGDSVTCRVKTISPAPLDGSPTLNYRLFPNPLFDPYRINIPPGAGNTATEGAVECFMPAQFPNGSTWSADLPDSGFFFPGDVIHWYFRATDTDGGVGLVPADTSGFGNNPTDGNITDFYDPLFTVRALPSMKSTTALDQPKILVWDDSGSDTELNAWVRGMTSLGQDLGVDYDLYRTQYPRSHYYNGLGSLQSAAMLEGYETIFYSAGEQDTFTINPADDRVLGDDQGTLFSWLFNDSRLLVLMGDNLMSALWNDENLVSRDWARTIAGVTWMAKDVRPQIDGQEFAIVEPVPGDPIFDQGGWAVDAGCPDIKTIDYIEPMPAANLSAEFETPGGTGSYMAAAAVNMPFFAAGPTSEVVTLPYALHTMEGAVVGIPDLDSGKSYYPAGVMRFLSEILTYQGHPVSGADLPERPVLSLAARPNPFNPRTEIRYSLDIAGPVSVDLYDLRGRRVRRLVDEVRPAGGSVTVWDGRDDDGRGMSSGVYFCILHAESGKKAMKVTLLR
jgi:hypothetical protein